MTTARRWPVPEPGCYAPAVTFFDHTTDTLALSAQAQYYRYLSQTGLRGLVILGTNAEPMLLSRSERLTLLKLARSSVPANFPIIAGVSGHSTAQVLEYISDAHSAGADYVLLLPCAYFGAQTTRSVVKGFFAQVAAKSPLPIVLYNFPAVCNGFDMDSGLIAEIARENPSVVGVKLTCGSVAKIVRLAAEFEKEDFAVLGGQSDFLLGGLAVGSAGCVAAFANVAPRSVARVWELWNEGKQEEALALQKLLAVGEGNTKGGVGTVKYAAGYVSAVAAGIEGWEALVAPRSPYEPLAAGIKEQIKKGMKPIRKLEGVGAVPKQQARTYQGGEVRARL